MIPFSSASMIGFEPAGLVSTWLEQWSYIYKIKHSIDSILLQRLACGKILTLLCKLKLLFLNGLSEKSLCWSFDLTNIFVDTSKVFFSYRKMVEFLSCSNSNVLVVRTIECHVPQLHIQLRGVFRNLPNIMIGRFAKKFILDAW